MRGRRGEGRLLGGRAGRRRENPLLAEAARRDWPATPAGQHYAAVAEAAAWSRRPPALTPATAEGRDVPPRRRRRGRPTPPRPSLGRATPPSASWRPPGRRRGLLLAERDRSRGTDGVAGRALPAHLSVSSLVALARDPAALARQIRRPMPRPPAPYARRGTAFHRWLEERWGQQRLLDLDDLPGASDDGAATRS